MPQSSSTGTIARTCGRTPPRHGARLPAAALASLLALLLGALALSPPALAEPAASRPGAFGPIYEHIAYGPRLRQYLNVYASRTPRSPLVVLVHGGGWRYFDALVHFESESLGLQAQGFTVVTINYDQDSERTPAFPTEPNDVSMAVKWAIANAAAYNGDPGKLVLLGGSAGGHLSALVAEQMNAAAPGTVKGVVTLSGPTNFRQLMPLIEANKLPNEGFKQSVLQAVGREPSGKPYLFSNPAEQEAYEARWSPALQVNPKGCARWLIFHSEAELIPLSQAEQLNAKLKEAGCSSTLQVLPGARHAFTYWGSISAQVFSFIKSI